MAGVFSFVVIAVGLSLFIGLKGYFRHGRRGRWLFNPCLPAVMVIAVLAAYLVVKVAYEEIYPCVAVDSKYCDFSSTQCHKLFGWEF